MHTGRSSSQRSHSGGRSQSRRPQHGAGTAGSRSTSSDRGRSMSLEFVAVQRSASQRSPSGSRGRSHQAARGPFHHRSPTSTSSAGSSVTRQQTTSPSKGKQRAATPSSRNSSAGPEQGRPIGPSAGMRSAASSQSPSRDRSRDRRSKSVEFVTGKAVRTYQKPPASRPLPAGYEPYASPLPKDPGWLIGENFRNMSNSQGSHYPRGRR